MQANTPTRISDLTTEAGFDAYMQVFAEPHGTRLNDLDAIVAAGVEYSVRVMAPAFISLEAGLQRLEGEAELPNLRWFDAGAAHLGAFEIIAPDASGAHSFVLDFRGRQRPTDAQPTLMDMPRRISCYVTDFAARAPEGASIQEVLAIEGPQLVFTIDLPHAWKEAVLSLPGSARVEDSGAALVALRAAAGHMHALGCGDLMATRHEWAGSWAIEFRGPQRERLMAALGVATLRADGVAPG